MMKTVPRDIGDCIKNSAAPAAKPVVTKAKAADDDNIDDNLYLAEYHYT